MTFCYPTQYDKETPDINNKVLPILNDYELEKVYEATQLLSLEDKKGALDKLHDMLCQLSCTCEKDSFCDFITAIIKVAYHWDERRERMIEDLEDVIYQMF